MRGPITITVAGEPMAWSRAGANTNAGHVTLYTPARVRSRQNEVKDQALRQMGGAEPWEGPIAMKVVGYLSVPVSWPAWRQDAALAGLVMPTKTPDLDNIAKLILDAINKLVFRDDAQVVDLLMQKRFAARPRVVATVVELDLGTTKTKKADMPTLAAEAVTERERDPLDLQGELGL